MPATAPVDAAASSVETLVELATRQVWPAILRPDVLCRYTAMSRKRLYEIMRDDPTFPRQIRFSNRCVGWSRTSIDRWIAKKEGMEAVQ